ncbi:cyclin N-terminal domain-containing protein 1 [Bufo gargarizans]|uniref:cyclin N-terminal domain-containing protein 1 n=1 Tax=Bufo gargarizans TaxID=30331 RepID=UPI001CF33A7B|nr:cyclin N-terminal domain-containing protein 1 [Bufo gargarizans]
MNQLPIISQRASRHPETIFGIAPFDVIADILIGLANDNERILDHLSEHAGSFKQPKVIELVFLLSVHWCQDNSTKYQAVELLDRFMILHVEELYKSSAESLNVMESSQVKSWGSLKASLCHKFMLHLASCIQITSKLHFHSKIINNPMVLQFLRSAGYAYKREDPLRSELTVLKTLNFRMNIHSPFAYVEMLLEVLEHNGCSLPLKDVHNMCVMVMDLVYLLRTPMYEALLKASVDVSTPTSLQRSKFLSVKEDQMFLGTGVISASTFIVSQDAWNQVLEHLSNITGISVNSVFELCSAILKHCVGDTALLSH